MTTTEPAKSGHRRHAIHHRVAQLLNWWTERRRSLDARRAITHLPDHLLRDVGLEHRIRSNRDLILLSAPL